MQSIQLFYFFIWAIILIGLYQLFLCYKKNRKIKQILNNLKFIINKYDKQNISLIKKFLKKLYKKWILKKWVYNRLLNNINLYIMYWYYDTTEYKAQDLKYLVKLYQFVVGNTIKELKK